MQQTPAWTIQTTMQTDRKLQTTQSFDAPTAVLYRGFAHHADYSIFAQELPASESMLAATRTACWDMATVAVHCRRAVLARDWQMAGWSRWKHTAPTPSLQGIITTVDHINSTLKTQYTLAANRNSHTGFRLAPILMTLNNLERQLCTTLLYIAIAFFKACWVKDPQWNKKSEVSRFQSYTARA